LGLAAIGALLQTPRLATVAQISEAIGPATHNEGIRKAIPGGIASEASR
jgi:hypothetical protein